MSDKELRDSGKLSRPVIGPAVTVVVNQLKKVPIRAWFWVLIAVGCFFVGRIVLREVREDAKNYAVAEVAEKHAKEVRQVSEQLGKELDTAKKTNDELLQKLDAAAAAATTKRQASKANTAKKKAVVASHTTVAEVSQDVQNFLKIFPRSVTEDTLTFDVGDVRGLVVTQIEFQDLQLENEFLNHQLGVERQRVDILKDNEKHYMAVITADKDTIKALSDEAAAYKKAAKKTTWRKFLGGVKTVGIAVIPAAVVYLIMSGK